MVLQLEGAFEECPSFQTALLFLHEGNGGPRAPFGTDDKGPAKEKIRSPFKGLSGGGGIDSPNIHALR